MISALLSFNRSRQGEISGARADSEVGAEKVKKSNDDPVCTFGGNLQPGSQFFSAGVKPRRPRCQIEP